MAVFSFWRELNLLFKADVLLFWLVASQCVLLLFFGGQKLTDGGGEAK